MICVAIICFESSDWLDLDTRILPRRIELNVTFDVEYDDIKGQGPGISNDMGVNNITILERNEEDESLRSKEQTRTHTAGPFLNPMRNPNIHVPQTGIPPPK